MRYYGDITKQLQIILVKKWVKANYFKRIITKLIGVPICPTLPYTDLIKRLLEVEL